MIRNRGCPSRWRTLVAVPVTRLSIARTSQPRSIRQSHRCEPRNPAPPVTTARIWIAFPCRLFPDDCVTSCLRILSHSQNERPRRISHQFRRYSAHNLARRIHRVFVGVPHGHSENEGNQRRRLTADGQDRKSVV